MTNSPKRRRSIVSTLIAVVAIVAMAAVMAVMRLNAFFRRTVPIESLKFPVLVIQPNGIAPFAEWEAVDLQKIVPKSGRSPVDGTILIDSDFNLYRQENVVSKESDIGWLARRYITPGLRIKYTFDLRRVRPSGRAAVMERIGQVQRFSEDPAENDAMRNAVANQTTLAGVLDTLKLYKPIEPAPTTTEAGEAEPAPTVEPNPK